MVFFAVITTVYLYFCHTDAFFRRAYCTLLQFTLYVGWSPITVVKHSILVYASPNSTVIVPFKWTWNKQMRLLKMIQFIETCLVVIHCPLLSLYCHYSTSTQLAWNQSLVMYKLSRCRFVDSSQHQRSLWCAKSNRQKQLCQFSRFA